MTRYPVLTNDRYWSVGGYSFYNQALSFSNNVHKHIARSYQQMPGSVAAYWRGLKFLFW